MIPAVVPDLFAVLQRGNEEDSPSSLNDFPKSVSGFGSGGMIEQFFQDIFLEPPVGGELSLQATDKFLYQHFGAGEVG